MKTLIGIVSLAAVGGGSALMANFVELQASTPGTVQTGNLNISGVAKATKFEAFNTAA